MVPYQWSIKSHQLFAQSTKDVIFYVLSARKILKENIISKVPKPVLYLVFEFLTSPPYPSQTLTTNKPQTVENKKNCVVN